MSDEKKGKQIEKNPKASELSDKDLENVAGGGGPTIGAQQPAKQKPPVAGLGSNQGAPIAPKKKG